MFEQPSRDWTKISSSLPPEETLVETMNSEGNVSLLRRRGCLFFLHDDSMYVYYDPIFWRMLGDEDV